MSPGPFAAIVVAMAIFLVLPGQVNAQTDLGQLLNRIDRIDRIDRLERETQTLSQAVFRDGVQAPQALAVSQGGSFGGGDYAEQVEVRLQNLERQLQSLTGAIEEIRNDNRQMSNRLDRALNDIEFRLDDLEDRSVSGQQSGAVDDSYAGSAPDDATSGSEEAGTAPTPPTPPDSAPPDSAPVVTDDGDLDPTVRSLGTIPLRGGRPDPPPQSQNTPPSSGDESIDTQVADTTAPLTRADTSSGGGSVEAQYDQAYGLITSGEYGEAESAFQDFLQQHPDHALASNAQYWLAETYYIRGRFDDAAVTFAQGYQEYPDGNKAVDNLLKLGLSLAAMEEYDDACLTLRQVGSRFPDSPSRIRQRAEQETDRLDC